MADRPLRLSIERADGALQRKQRQEHEPERLPLSEHFLWLHREPRALHVWRQLCLQGCLHLRERLRLRDQEVATLGAALCCGKIVT
jgi:hypothetical protein